MARAVKDIMLFTYFNVYLYSAIFLKNKNSRFQLKLRTTRYDQPESTEPVFLNVYGAQESITRNEFASLRSLAGRYDNPIPPRLLAPIDCLKIPAL